MKICIIVEGAYPYLTGGVSSWVQQLINYMPDTEFVVQALCSDRYISQESKYKPPSNLTEIRNVYLMDDDYVGRASNRLRLNKQQQEMLEELLFGEDVNWEYIFHFFSSRKLSLNSLLNGKYFFESVKKYYESHFPQLVFTDFLWTMRSMYMPVFQCLRCPPIKADLYHTISTGYAGILGSYESFLTGAPLILSEHGIYTREREQEIIRADWVLGHYKDLWIQQFRKLSSCSYQSAAIVTSLFEGARELQQELGCPLYKTRVIPNGIKLSRFADIKERDPNDEYINIGALLRVTPIKDVKTMISAFAIAKKHNSKIKLWIMGPQDENKQYVEECFNLVAALGVEDVVFTGSINSFEYIQKMDFMILTSLSEGQPLTILEGFAASKPSIATNVGSCKELIEGKAGDYEAAGYVVSPMNPEATAEAILKLANNPQRMKDMGDAGLRRVRKYHDESEIFDQYYDLYYSFKDLKEN